MTEFNQNAMKHPTVNNPINITSVYALRRE